MLYFLCWRQDCAIAADGALQATEAMGGHRLYPWTYVLLVD